MTESNEWTDWIPEIERIKRMQADIDALKCERAKLQEDRANMLKKMVELLDALMPFARDVSIGALDSDRITVSYFPRIDVGDLRNASRAFYNYRS